MSSQQTTNGGGNFAIMNPMFSVVSSTGTNMVLSTGSPVVTIPGKAFVSGTLQVNIGFPSAAFAGAYLYGSDGIYYALAYQYIPTNGATWVSVNFTNVVINAGVTLTPWVYMGAAGTIGGSGPNDNIFRMTISISSFVV